MFRLFDHIVNFQKWLRKNPRNAYIVATAFGSFAGIFFFLFSLIYATRGAIIPFYLSLVPQKHLSGVNILLVGVDDTKDVQRSDTIMVLHADHIHNRIGALSLPRDTRTNIPGHGISKINHAYAWGGIPLLHQSVASFLNLPLHYYIKINLNGIEKIVDEIGGVPVEVDHDMRYVDKAGNLDISLKKGHHVLSGKDTGAFLRFRHDAEGDIGRIKRQHGFLRALAERLLESGHFWRSPTNMSQLSNAVETDLSTPEMLGFVSQFSEAFKQNRIASGSIPGSVTVVGGISYWQPDITGTDAMIDDVLFGEKRKELLAVQTPTTPSPQLKPTPFQARNLSIADNRRGPTSSVAKNDASAKKGGALPKRSLAVEVGPTSTGKALLSAAPPIPASTVSLRIEAPKGTVAGKTTTKFDDSRRVKIEEVTRVTEQIDLKDKSTRDVTKKSLKIEVLNGIGAEGSAKSAARLLKLHGFRIARFDNSKGMDYKQTMIVDWKGNIQNVLVLADFLGIDPGSIVVYDRPKKRLDVTIVVGRDWQAIVERVQRQNVQKSL